MSNSAATSPFERAIRPAADDSSRAPGWLREPLLHFLLLGGLLFGIDHIVAGQADDPHTIIVGPEVDAEAVSIFRETHGRDPNEEELNALHRVWLDNEVLYREGLAMQVDKGDTAIRERVIFKALSIVDAGVKLPPLDDAQLREWFEQNRAKYDEPARYNFQEAVLSGASSEEAIRAFVARLNSGAPGDAEAGLRVFKDRPLANLVQSYGPDFPKQLNEVQADTWQALKVGDTWHALRVDSIAAPQPAVFEPLRGIVLQDWTDAMAAEQRTAAVRTLAKKYQVIFSSPSEPAGP
jgi:hypothetical protein